MQLYPVFKQSSFAGVHTALEKFEGMCDTRDDGIKNVSLISCVHLLMTDIKIASYCTGVVTACCQLACQLCRSQHTFTNKNVATTGNPRFINLCGAIVRKKGNNKKKQIKTARVGNYTTNNSDHDMGG